MSSIKSTEETRQEYIDLMGPELGKVYYALWCEVAELHIIWDEYVQLFGTKPERIDTLNHAAPHFFQIIRSAFHENIVLHVTRLTDVQKKGKKKRLTVHRISDYVSNPDLKKHIDSLVNKALSSSEACIDWRNRRYAHRNMDIVLGEGDRPLKPVGREKIRGAIDSIAAVVKSIELYYTKAEIMFDPPVAYPAGSTALLYYLDMGLKAEARRIERLKKNEPLPYDFERPKI